MSEPTTYYRIDYTQDASEGAWVRSHTESLVRLGVLVPVELDLHKMAMFLFERQGYTGTPNPELFTDVQDAFDAVVGEETP